jgi:type III secretion system-like peptide-binding chaperone
MTIYRRTFMAAELVPEIQQMMTRYLQEIGLNADTSFKKENNAWYWSRGSANIEVYVDAIDMGNNRKRLFLRVFSPLVTVPPNAGTAFYRRLLELNDKSLGVKLTLYPATDKIYATYERDIKGMDYDEMADTIADLEWWADNIDDKLMQEFGAIK